MTDKTENKGEDVNTSESKNSPKKNGLKQPEPKKRENNADFFSRDILGHSQRERLVKEITLKTRTAKALYNLTYERLDTYLHRPKEVASLVIAKNVNEELQKIIHNRILELENYVNKRHKKVKSLYESATTIESFNSDTSSDLNINSGFSTGYANRILSIILKIDEACFMAGYLEKTGVFTISQESNLTSELYRKHIQISRGLLVFIGRSIIGIRKSLKQGKET